jgi:hypothetical protein
MANILKGRNSANESAVTDLEQLGYYNNLVDFRELKREVLVWKTTLQKYADKNLVNSNSIASIANLLVENNLMATFPQMISLMRVYLAIPATSAAAERAFSVLKRIKTWLRNTMVQERLSSLAILSIEKELLELIDIQDIVSKFAALKNRRTQFSKLFFICFFIIS